MYIDPEFYELLISKAVYFDLLMKLYKETGYINDALFGAVITLTDGKAASEALKRASAASEE